MRRDVIAVGMRDKRKRLLIPGIEPNIFARQINTPVVANFDHGKFYLRNGGGETGIQSSLISRLH
jgi:hypothetical protein